eukprot:jgi/Chrzof1/2638/Cz11g23130.t1
MPCHCLRSHINRLNSIARTHQHRQLHLRQHTRQQHQQQRGRLQATPEDPFFNLWKSKVFQNEMVVRDFDSITSELRQLSTMLSKFPDFDLSGKRMFVEKMQESCERYQIFMKRLDLSDDPNAKEFLRYTNAQMLEGGFSWHTMFEGLNQVLGQYQQWVEQEERASVDPVKHQQFLQQFRQQWKQSPTGRMDLSSYFTQFSDPVKISKAQSDPEVSTRQVRYRCRHNAMYPVVTFGCA